MKLLETPGCHYLRLKNFGAFITGNKITSQHLDNEIPHGLRDNVIVPDTSKIMVSLEIESADKARSVLNNVSRALVKKKELILGSEAIDTVNNSDIYDTYKNLFLSEKKREVKLL